MCRRFDLIAVVPQSRTWPIPANRHFAVGTLDRSNLRERMEKDRATQRHSRKTRPVLRSPGGPTLRRFAAGPTGSILYQLIARVRFQKMERDNGMNLRVRAGHSRKVSTELGRLLQ